MRYAIYAGDQMYGGLHGMCYYTVVEVENANFAEELAREESFNVIDSYNSIYEDIEEEVQQTYEDNPELTEIELDEIREELREQDLEWTVWEIDEKKAGNYSTNDLDRMIDNSPEEFIDNFCKQ